MILENVLSLDLGLQMLMSKALIPGSDTKQLCQFHGTTSTQLQLSQEVVLWFGWGDDGRHLFANFHLAGC